MKLIKPVAPLLTLLPSLAYIPVLIEVAKGFHLGGINIIFIFISSALNPSLNQLVVKSAWDGLQITLAIALTSWVISMLIGTILGVLSTNLLCKSIPYLSFFSKSLKYSLAVPRSIHEVIWGILFIQVLGLNTWVAIISIVIPHSALTARVISEQLDSVDINNLIAIKKTGSNSLSSFLTILLPKLLPIITNYGTYRLECSIRGATLLGIFGLGGIGTELYLTLKSMEFREMWTYLWMLFIVMILLEKLINYIRNNYFTDSSLNTSILTSLSIFLLSISFGLTWLYSLNLDTFSPITYTSLNPLSFLEIRTAFQDLPLLQLIITTITITLLASGIAIGTPPLLLLSLPNKFSLKVQNIIWIFFRLIPPPLTAIIILLFTSPNISVSALSLGITHMGVMGRLLTDSILSQEKSIYLALKNNGSSIQSATLYGLLTPKSNSYLAYGSYRTDVILKETAIIGAVGGVGLGWQLQESLTSFNWAQVMIITFTFSVLTISGEFLFNSTQNFWLRNSTNSFIN
tara:strand:- start:3348 stop:4898 length:1551 start_codon:yes stop_codon:yes gene_type:complete